MIGATNYKVNKKKYM